MNVSNEKSVSMLIQIPQQLHIEKYHAVENVQEMRPSWSLASSRKGQMSGELSRWMTLQELRSFSQLPQILVALNGNVYDVTKSAGFYGPGGRYGIMAGRDASRSLATGQLDPKLLDDADITNLTPNQVKAMHAWEDKFRSKYPIVARLKHTKGGAVLANL
eukprot:g28199.t1